MQEIDISYAAKANPRLQRAMELQYFFISWVVYASEIYWIKFAV